MIMGLGFRIIINARRIDDHFGNQALLAEQFERIVDSCLGYPRVFCIDRRKNLIGR